jgi:hypothetical protein
MNTAAVATMAVLKAPMVTPLVVNLLGLTSCVTRQSPAVVVYSSTAGFGQALAPSPSRLGLADPEREARAAVAQPVAGSTVVSMSSGEADT